MQTVHFFQKKHQLQCRQCIFFKKSISCNASDTFFQKNALAAIFPAPPFPPKMPQGRNRVVPQHPRAGVAHDDAHPLPHLRFITMYGAQPAGRFPFTERTAVQAREGVASQLLADGTQLGVPLLAPAVEAYHPLDGRLLLADTALVVRCHVRRPPSCSYKRQCPSRSDLSRSRGGNSCPAGFGNGGPRRS